MPKLTIKLLTLSLALVLAAGLWAAATGKNRVNLPDEMRGLANIDKVHLLVQPLPAPLLKQGMTAQDVIDLVTPILTDAGFEIVDKQITPSLLFTIQAATDPSVPGTVGFGVFIDIVQKVRLHRLNEDLTIPTATIPSHGVKRPADLPGGVKDHLRTLVKRFIDMEKFATENR